MTIEEIFVFGIVFVCFLPFVYFFLRIICIIKPRSNRLRHNDFNFKWIFATLLLTFGVAIFLFPQIDISKIGTLDSPVTMMWITLLMSAPFWFMGYFGQLSGNFGNLNGYKLSRETIWSPLLGLKPRQHTIFFRFAFWQTLSWAYLVAGYYLAWFGTSDTFKSVTGWFFALFIGSGILLAVFDRK